MSENSYLSRLVARASEDSHFVGHTVGQYKRMNAVDDAEVASRLRCSVEDLSRLALCRLPDPASRSFLVEIRTVAEFGRCDADSLLAVVREVQSVLGLRSSGSEHTGSFLMAARDRKEGDPADTEGEP